MIAIGNNKLKKRYITDSNGNEQEAKKVYIGTNLVHLHMQDSNNPFAYRITNDGKIGEAVSVKGEISNIKGNTVSWNQLYNTEVPTAVSGHSYYLRENIEGVISKRISAAISYTEESTERNCCDLTLIYGAGNEPTTTTEQFEAYYERWFGKPLTYEAYNAGELIPVKTTAVKTIGFNQWDEEWMNGYVDNQGNVIPGSSHAITKNAIRVFPNTAYHWHESELPSNNGYILGYDIARGYLGIIATRNSLETDFTTPANCYYIRVQYNGAYSTINQKRFTLNLSCTRNGTYEPYEEHTLQLPITTLTGKLNGEGESVVVFPDGMKKAGSIRDEIYISGGKTYAVKRVGSVDIGTIQGFVITSSGLFQRQYFVRDYNAKANSDSYLPSVLVMAEYKAVGASPISGTDTEKEVALHWSEGHLYINTVGQYTNVATFIAAMQGVMLYYELESPLVYELDDFELPKNYIANGLGTEELLPANDTALVTAPADMTIDYTLN